MAQKKASLYNDIPDQSGKVAIVTGGNTGIGKIACRELLEKGAKVYMGARSKERAEEAIAEIKKSTGKDNIHWLPMDLSDLASVGAAADQIKRDERELHILINNAGIMATEYATTKDGYEMQWGTNVVGHFALISKLLPLLLETADHCPPGTVRVINVTSQAHKLAPGGGIVFKDIGLTGGFWFAEWRRYGQSKLGNILLTKEITRRFTDRGIISVAVHPGVIVTQLHSNVKQSWSASGVLTITRPKPISEEEGGYTSVFAATHPKVIEENMNGKYIEPFGKVVRPSGYARDEKLAQKLWEYLEADLQSKVQKS